MWSGYDLKLACDELVPSITHIINLSIIQKKFPSSWKISKVIALHKKDEMFLAKNFRPVSLLSVISKVLEKVIFLQLFKYLEDNSLIHPSHHAYRPSHNTTSAMLEMIGCWIEAFEDDDITAAVMVDQSAAFDVCDHVILISKLKIYGVQDCALAWFSSYLEDRKQTVYVEGSLSETRKLEKAGVPKYIVNKRREGSPSHLFFTIYFVVIFLRPFMINMKRRIMMILKKKKMNMKCI